jgi:hypothetical protein
MPILGITASQKSAHLFTQGAYDSIATVTVGAGGSSSVSFTSIPSTYTHLQVRGITRNSANVGGDASSFRFNSDSSNSYTQHYLAGNGATASASYTTAIAQGYWGVNQADASRTTGVFTPVVFDILDYANTSKYKTVRVLSGTDDNGATCFVTLSSNVYIKTDAITSMTIYPYNVGSNNWAQYTQFALYGIKAA